MKNALKMSRFLIALFVCLLFTVSSDVERTIRLKFLIPWKTGPLRIGPRIGSAISVGLKSIKARNILPEYDIVWDLTDTECHPLSSIRGIVDSLNRTEYGEVPVGALIGGGCSVVCEPIARLSAFRNIAFVSFGCTSDGLSNRRQYWTFTRTIGSWHQLCIVFNLVADKFYWKRIAVFYTSQPIMQSTATELCRLLKVKGKLAFPREIVETMDGNLLNQNSYRELKGAIGNLMNKANGNDHDDFMFLILIVCIHLTILLPVMTDSVLKVKSWGLLCFFLSPPAGNAFLKGSKVCHFYTLTSSWSLYH